VFLKRAALNPFLKRFLVEISLYFCHTYLYMQKVPVWVLVLGVAGLLGVAGSSVFLASIHWRIVLNLYFVLGTDEIRD
jgi:hypothetical protein